MVLRKIGCLEMEHIGSIEPERENCGNPLELFPQARYRNVNQLPFTPLVRGPAAGSASAGDAANPGFMC